MQGKIGPTAEHQQHRVRTCLQDYVVFMTVALIGIASALIKDTVVIVLPR